MAYGFRLKAIVSTALAGVPGRQGDSEIEPIDLPRVGGGRCTLRLEATDSGRTVISLVGRGYESEAAAQDAGSVARGALRHAGLLTKLSVDFGHEPARGTRLSEAYQEAVRDKIGNVQVIGDAHGLVTWEDDGTSELMVVRMEAHGIAGHRVEPLIEVLRESLLTGAGLEGDAVALASDLYFLSDFETSDRARFLTVVTSLEVLSRQERQPPAVEDLVRGFERAAREAAQLTPEEDEATRKALRSLVGSLGRLRRESILSAIGKLVRNGPYPPGEAPADPIADADLAQHAYNVRSSLVHDGREPEGVDLRSLTSDLRPVVWNLLRGQAVAE